MSIHAIDSNIDPVAQAKIDLAASLRLAVFHELEEGIDNHFTVTVPGYDNRYLVLPFGLHWSEARASDMIVFNEAGETLEGDGDVELSAQCIHAPIHRISGRRVVFHTHQNWALALNMLEDNRLIPACQTSAFFAGQIAYDDHYSGTADTLQEGERLAGLIGNHPVVFMRIFKMKRGYYEFEFEVLEMEPRSTAHGDITMRFMQRIEARSGSDQSSGSGPINAGRSRHRRMLRWEPRPSTANMQPAEMAKGPSRSPSFMFACL